MIRPFLCSAMALLAAGFSANADSGGTPVVVELFTSQGCSSCPPADEFLEELSKQPVDGVRIIPISWHVDYWNRLGWTDLYSSKTATTRQNRYAAQFNLRSLYTPQMVVDGQTEFVGSDQRQGLAAIKGARHNKTSLRLSVENQDGELKVYAKPERIVDDWRALLVLTEDNVTTKVKRGENGGRTLSHTGVVRASSTMREDGEGGWVQSLTLPEDAGELNVVVLVQDGNGRIVAADMERYRP